MASSTTEAALGVWEDPHGELTYSRAPNYERFASRATPEWFNDSKLGIFIHWGAYAVPAWAETLSKSGDLPPDSHYSHTPYSEWYFNTIRFPGLPAARHHEEVYQNAPYDNFLDSWKAEAFDARDMVRLFKKAGATFLIPTSKHHDGITLWNAPGTEDRNTVKRGPRRDFMAEWDQACKEEAMKFGVYYSTGIDWHFWPTSEPWDTHQRSRPGLDAVDYNKYAWEQCQDLIKRHKPYFLWGDVSWPEAGVAPGPHSVETLLDSLYDANPNALINDRFGKTHWDFKTEEYGMGVDPDKIDTAWQACRGIGLSFGYNQNEDDSHSMSARQAIRFLLHAASRGGNLLLNVGPDAAGNIPSVQRRCLEGMGDWIQAHGSIDGTRRVEASIAKPIGGEGGDEEIGKEWVRWLKRDKEVYAYVDSGDPEGQVTLMADWQTVDRTSARSLGRPITVGENGLVDISTLPGPMPGCITFQLVDI